MASGIDSSRWSRIALRTSSCVYSVQPHTGLLLGRHRLVGAADHGGEDLLDQAGARAAGRRRPWCACAPRSSVNSPFSLIALTMLTFFTPLQPHTSKSSGSSAARLLPSWPALPVLRLAEHQLVAQRLHAASSSRISWKYQPESAVSP